MGDPNGARRVVVKGAAEEVLGRCTSGSAWGDDWKTVAMAALDALLARGARALAIAIRPDSENRSMGRPKVATTW